MPFFLAAVFTLTFCGCLSAQGLSPQSVIIEPPAPASYTDDRPAYAFFKKIEITPRNSGSYDVVMTMQADIPTTFPKDRGLDISMNFDFAEISPEKSLPTNRIPNFHDDLMVSFNRNVGFAKFETFAAPVEYHGRKWEFKITNLIIRKDVISFSLRSPLFNLHPSSQVVFRTNPMKAQSATQSSGTIAQETTPISPDLPSGNPPK